MIAEPQGQQRQIVSNFENFRALAEHRAPENTVNSLRILYFSLFTFGL